MKLSDIDPAKVGDEAHDAVAAQAHRLAFAAGLELREGTGLSDVRHAVRAIAHYAQTGEQPEGRPELIGEYLQSVAEPLYTRAGTGPGYDVPDLDEEADPATPWGLVLLAACGRHLIEQGEHVTLAHLAVLAGVDIRPSTTGKSAALRSRRPSQTVSA